MVKKYCTLKLATLLVLPTVIFGITTIHHDKPEGSQILQMASKMNGDSDINRKIPVNVTLERQKRLLPYINYYLNRNSQKLTDPPHRQLDQQQATKITLQESFRQSEKFTPFLESNAIPGPFTPLVKDTQKNNIEYVSQPATIENNPDFSTIYDTLVRLKQAQQLMRPPTLQSHIIKTIYPKPDINYIPTHYYDHQRHQTIQPIKTVIETYTPTNIDISQGEKGYENVHTTVKNNKEQVIYELYPNRPQIEDSFVGDPQHNYKTQNVFTTIKPYFGEKLLVRKPVILYQQKPALHEEKEYTQTERPIMYTIQTTAKPQVKAIIDEKYVAQKFTPVSSVHLTDYENVQIKHQHQPVEYVTEQYEPNYEQQYYSTPVPKVVHIQQSQKNLNVLGQILKQLQNSNMLPHTLTLENIDNSIRTLVKILNNLRKQQSFQAKPIVVAEQNSEENMSDDDEKPHYVPDTITQTFPANTIEGGTPGRPGIDYPALSSIPPTSFNCKTQRYKGFFGDPNTNCQVWHYCDLNGGQASFLCPNGTIFSQVALTCDWWYNVKCSATPQLYVLNERLYKYIIPLTPKFPEDYSGPLVDRYLALKFKEMEEKMKKEKKDEDKNMEDSKDDSDHLQDIQNEKRKFTSSEET